jgi:hypothetical protein
MSTKFLSPGWRMPRNANQNKQANYSLQRTGVNQYVQADNISFDSGPSFTISCWVFKADIDASGLYAFYGTEHYGNSTGGFVIYYGSGGVTFYSSLPGSGSYFSFSTANNLLVDNVWQQVIIRYNYGVDYRIYINNVLRAVNTTNNSATWPEQNIRLFRHYSNDGYDHDGALSDWCFFNYALSDTATSVGDTATGQIAQLYGDGSSLPNPMALPSPPKAYYPLGESAGGFVGGSGTWLTENNAIGDYVFDFIPNDYISLNSDISLTGSKTVSFWFKADNIAGNNVVIGGTQSSPNINYYPYITSTGICLRDSTGYICLSGLTFNDGVWYHLSIVGDGTTATVYKNGQSQGTLDDKNPTINTIGAFSNAASAFDGKLSNVQIFNTTLSLTEVQTLYNNGSPIRTLANIPQSSNLKAWYKLDASEVYNSSSTKWSINNALSPWTSSLSFNGSAGVTTAGITGIATSNSISFWFNNSIAAGGIAPLIASLNYISGALQNFAIRLETTNKLTVVLLKNGNYTFLYSNTVLANNTWHFVTLTTSTSGSNVINTLYINGAQDVTNTGSNNSNLADLVNGLTIGYWTAPGSATYNFNGSISNVAIYNTALSAPNVLTLYNGGTPQTTIYGSPIAHWKLDNTTTGIQDSAGNYNATNSGAVEAIGSVSTLNGESSGMSQSNLVQSDLQTVAPYSKYAMSFDGANDYINLGQPTDFTNIGSSDFTQSCWIYQNSFTSGSAWHGLIYIGARGSSQGHLFVKNNSGTAVIGCGIGDGATNSFGPSNETTYSINNGQWYHIAYVKNSTSLTLYVNGDFVQSFSSTISPDPLDEDAYIGQGFVGYSEFFDGYISNVSIWNAALTSSQVREIYNQGLPGNLNSHSAYSNLVSWWQLGENSSYVGGWIFADEKGTNNGTGIGLAETDLTNGVGTTANGTSSGMAVGDLVGDAPYSTANAISSGMSVVSRVTGSGNTP